MIEALTQGEAGFGSGATGGVRGVSRRVFGGGRRVEAVAERERAKAYGRGREDGRSGAFGGVPPSGRSRLFEGVDGGRRAYLFGFRDGREER